MIYWVTYTNRGPGCVQGPSEPEARLIAATYGVVATIERLPYPAKPLLNEPESIPFCYSPSTCAGRTCCPKRPSCVS